MRIQPLLSRHSRLFIQASWDCPAIRSIHQWTHTILTAWRLIWESVVVLEIICVHRRKLVYLRTKGAFYMLIQTKLNSSSFLLQQLNLLRHLRGKYSHHIRRSGSINQHNRYLCNSALHSKRSWPSYDTDAYKHGTKKIMDYVTCNWHRSQSINLLCFLLRALSTTIAQHCMCTLN